MDEKIESGEWTLSEIHDARPEAAGGTGEWEEKYMSQMHIVDQERSHKALYDRFGKQVASKKASSATVVNNNRSRGQ